MLAKNVGNTYSAFHLSPRAKLKKIVGGLHNPNLPTDFVRVRPTSFEFEFEFDSLTNRTVLEFCRHCYIDEHY